LKKNEQIRPRRGYLVLIGGAEDRTGRKEILRRTVELNDARTVSIIPSASRSPAGLARQYARAFRTLGVRRVFTLDIRDRHEADLDRHAKRISASDLIFFTGGDQVRLVRLLGGSRAIEETRQALRRGATVAGSSAGAAAASDPMLFDGTLKGLHKGRVRHSRGFGFIRGITVDTHFVKRNRIGRLAQFLVNSRNDRGIGLSENTGMIIGPGGIGEVVGLGTVIVLNSQELSYSNYKECELDTPISLDGLRLGFLSAGIRFNIRRWSVVKS
jgi:cyanophycinase